MPKQKMAKRGLTPRRPHSVCDNEEDIIMPVNPALLNQKCEIRRIDPRCEKKETLFKSTQVVMHLRNGLWPLRIGIKESRATMRETKRILFTVTQ